MKHSVALIGLLSIATSALAQLVEYPIATDRSDSKTRRMSRTQSTEDPTFLPFFEDFSTSDTLLRDSLWLYGNSVSLNNGIGIHPPSKNVVSFDGADSLGKPYNVNDLLAKGFADRLTSQPIRMDLVSAPLQGTVYLSFFYQLKGNGEPPDPGDQLILSLKAQNGTWEDVYVLETDTTMVSDIFTQVLVPINDPKYFHDNFQFSFKNYARLSGPYDTWNLDYIYLNSGRAPDDQYYPDRTISTSFTSLFQDYFAMPVRHFLEDPDTNMVHPSIDLTNLQLASIAGGIQPNNYKTRAYITSRVNGINSTLLLKLDSAKPTNNLIGQQFETITLAKIPAAGDFDPLADSIHILLKYGMVTRDNAGLDYIPAIYDPIDFRYSDSTQANYTLSSYYAYDDGTAEYAAGLNQAGSYLAFLFNMRTLTPDTLVYVDIYFPEFGDNTSQSLLLQIRNNLTDNIAATLFEEGIVVDRHTKNKFARYTFGRPVPVNGAFYIGWKQLSNIPIPVGLDKNTNNGDKIYYNTNGIWIKNTTVDGSIMVRPGFGSGDGSIVTGGLDKKPNHVIYPNPSNGICFMKGKPDIIEAFDFTGKKLEIQTDTIGSDTRITLVSPVYGLILFRYLIDGQPAVQKIMVRGE